MWSISCCSITTSGLVTSMQIVQLWSGSSQSTWPLRRLAVLYQCWILCRLVANYVGCTLASQKCFVLFFNVLCLSWKQHAFVSVIVRLNSAQLCPQIQSCPCQFCCLSSWLSSGLATQEISHTMEWKPAWLLYCSGAHTGHTGLVVTQCLWNSAAKHEVVGLTPVCGDCISVEVKCKNTYVLVRTKKSQEVKINPEPLTTASHTVTSSHYIPQINSLTLVNTRSQSAATDPHRE